MEKWDICLFTERGSSDVVLISSSHSLATAHGYFFVDRVRMILKVLRVL